MKQNIYLENNRKYIRHLTGAETIYPRFLNLELTSRCNLRCIMCPKTVGFHTHKSDIEISDIVLEKIINQVLPGIYHINLMGFGEPLLARQKLFTLLKECKRLFITLNMITNGHFLTAEVCRELIDLKIYNLNVSLDAATAETYKKIRNSDYAKVIENLRTLKKIKEEKGSSLPTVDLSFVGMVDNIAELPEFIKTAHVLGARKVVLQALGEVPETLVHEKDIFIHNREMGIDNYNKALDIASDLGVVLELFPPDQFETMRDDNLAEHKIPERDGIKLIKDCIEPWNAVFISSEGGVSPCCGLPSMDNLNAADFNDIWLGGDMTRLREKIKTDEISQACIYCRGAGWRLPTIAEDEIIAGSNDDQLGMDWYTLDKENDFPFRWSGRKGTYFVKKSVSPAYIEVETLTPGAMLKVSLDDKEIFTSKMETELTRDRFYLELTLKSDTEGESNDIIKVTLETDRVLKPAEKSGLDGRLLGFKFFSHAKTQAVTYESNWKLIANLNKSFNKLDRAEGWIFVDSALQQGKSDAPSLFIHMAKTDGLISSLIERSLPDGVLRITKHMFSGSYKIKPLPAIENGSKLQQFQLSWQKKLPSGHYIIYAGLWRPESGERLKVIDPGNNLISRERIIIGTIILE
jgi:MoaA/NifB/PqqE/SkfB family radical SAM enzyme